MATTRPMAPAIVAVKRRNLSIAVGIAHCLRYLKRNNRQVLRYPCCNAFLCSVVKREPPGLRLLIMPSTRD